MKQCVLMSIMCLFLVGCETTQEFVKQREEKKEIVQEYFKNPKKDILVLIEALPGQMETSIQCHYSGSTLDSVSSSSGSFNDTTPYVKIMPSGKLIEEAVKTYRNLPEDQKLQAFIGLPAMMPVVSIICQNKMSQGLNGSIYFNGKQVASDNANIDYGTVSLSFTIPIQDIIKENK